MRGADQVHEGRARRNRSSKRGVVQSVADHMDRTGWKSLHRLGSCERMYGESSFEQGCDQWPAEVAGAARDEDRIDRHITRIGNRWIALLP